MHSIFRGLVLLYTFYLAFKKLNYFFFLLKFSVQGGECFDCLLTWKNVLNILKKENRFFCYSLTSIGFLYILVQLQIWIFIIQEDEPKQIVVVSFHDKALGLVKYVVSLSLIGFLIMLNKRLKLRIVRRLFFIFYHTLKP